MFLGFARDDPFRDLIRTKRSRGASIVYKRDGNKEAMAHERSVANVDRQDPVKEEIL